MQSFAATIHCSFFSFTAEVHAPLKTHSRAFLTQMVKTLIWANSVRPSCLKSLTFELKTVAGTAGWMPLPRGHFWHSEPAAHPLYQAAATQYWPLWCSTPTAPRVLRTWRCLRLCTMVGSAVCSVSFHDVQRANCTTYILWCSVQYGLDTDQQVWTLVVPDPSSSSPLLPHPHHHCLFLPHAPLLHLFRSPFPG